MGSAILIDTIAGALMFAAPIAAIVWAIATQSQHDGEPMTIAFTARADQHHPKLAFVNPTVR